MLYAPWYSYFYKSPPRSPITITSPIGLLTIQSFGLNCIFNPFDKSLLIVSKFTCNLGTWRTSLIQNLFIWHMTITMKPIQVVFMTLLSPKYTLHTSITSSYVTLREVMWFNVPNSLYIPFECTSYCITNKNSSIFWVLFAFFVWLFCLVVKTHNVV